MNTDKSAQAIFQNITTSGSAVYTFYTANYLPKNIPVTAVTGVVYNSKNQILLTKNQRGWDLTGGHVEQGETVIQALYREVFEEGGVGIQNPVLFGFFEIKNKVKKINKATGFLYPAVALIPFYFGSPQSEELKTLTAVECTEARWCDVVSKEVLASKAHKTIAVIHALWLGSQ